MKNKEKYANEIMEIACQGNAIAIDKDTKKIRACDEKCENCYFSQKNYIKSSNSYFCCETNIKDWANSEYVERKEFTEQEKLIVKVVEKAKWFAKDKNGKTFGFFNKPRKANNVWITDTSGYVILNDFTDYTFPTLSWEDTEPTSREEILREKK